MTVNYSDTCHLYSACGSLQPFVDTAGYEAKTLQKSVCPAPGNLFLAHRPTNASMAPGKYLLASSAVCPSEHFDIDGKLPPARHACSFVLCADLSTCEAAATHLGLADHSASTVELADSAPRGCFYETVQGRSKLRFNPGGVPDPADTARRAVCKGERASF